MNTEKIEEILRNTLEQIRPEILEQVIISMKLQTNRVIENIKEDRRYYNKKMYTSEYQTYLAYRNFIVYDSNSFATRIPIGLNEERIIEEAKKSVQFSIDSFVKKQSLKMDWIKENPSEIEISVKRERGTFTGFVKLIFNEKWFNLETSYELAYSKNGKLFVRFPSRFFLNIEKKLKSKSKSEYKMKSIQWMKENFFEKEKILCECCKENEAILDSIHEIQIIDPKDISKRVNQNWCDKCYQNLFN